MLQRITVQSCQHRSYHKNLKQTTGGSFYHGTITIRILVVLHVLTLLMRKQLYYYSINYCYSYNTDRNSYKCNLFQTYHAVSSYWLQREDTELPAMADPAYVQYDTAATPSAPLAPSALWNSLLQGNMKNRATSICDMIFNDAAYINPADMVNVKRNPL